MAIGGAVIADMYPPGERMRPMACYSAGTMLGPTLGPVLGGITTGSLDWRWVFWIASILEGNSGFGYSSSFLSPTCRHLYDDTFERLDLHTWI